MGCKVCNDVQQSWNKWKRKLKQIEQLHVQRCFKPADFGEVSSISLHHFSDASEVGYGQCSYIRMVNKEGKINCCLLLGKARVVPKKFVSIPGLELTAATLSVKVAKLLKACVCYFISIFYFSPNDSPSKTMKNNFYFI